MVYQRCPHCGYLGSKCGNTECIRKRARQRVEARQQRQQAVVQPQVQPPASKLTYPGMDAMYHTLRDAGVPVDRITGLGLTAADKQELERQWPEDED